MKLLPVATLAALVLAGCAGSPAASGGNGAGGSSPTATGGVALAISEAVDSNLIPALNGPAAMLATGSLGQAVITKQNWGLAVSARDIAAGTVVTLGPEAVSTPGKGSAVLNADGKAWNSQSGTITFEKLSSTMTGGGVVRLTDVVFKAVPYSKAAGSFKLNGTINAVAATAL